MARPRQPVELLLHKGKKHLTKTEIEERKATEIKASDDKVVAPSYLPADLKKEFNKISKELQKIGIISNLDIDTLARFITSKKIYVGLTTRLLDMDPLDEDFISILQSQDKLFKQCRQSATDLGLTISSRCKLVVPKKEEPKKKSEEEEMFGDAL